MAKLFGTLVAAIVFASGAWACSCMPANRDAIIAQSDAAFRAKVLSVRRSGDVNTGQVSARVRILTAYKGVRRGRIVILRTGANSAMCGIEFRRGETIAVGASRTGRSTFQTGLCSILPQ